VPEEQHLGDARLPSQIGDPRLEIERIVLEADRRFVVVRPRVHRQHQKAARGQFARGDVGEKIGRAMDQQDGNMGRRSRVRRVEHAFDRAGRERHIDGTALRGGGRSGGEHEERERRGAASHAPAPAWAVADSNWPSRIA
jgi:hypothetical protein